MPHISNSKKTALLAFLFTLTALVYLPGLTGGFYFDDYPNIIHNRGIELASLNLDELQRAAHSSNAGPLQRPIPMVSFALNHYFSGTDPFGYKLTNLAIHLGNAGLMFIFSLLLIRIATRNAKAAHFAAKTWMIAFLATAFWALHPVNLTSVLYVVQRMNSLASTFSLLALIAYLYARPQLNAGPRWLVLLIGGFTFFGLLAIYSKENAFLLPVFALLLEYTLFSSSGDTPRYWLILRRLALLILVTVTTWWLVQHLLLSDWAKQAYLPRTFTLKERFLTEMRVLWQYWGFILIPDSSKMGLYLDDFVISKGLSFPWSTLPALIGHVVLIAVAFTQRQKKPLIALGILWFYVGHSLESTLFPLELMYEHRNYLPMVGPVIALSYYATIGIGKASPKLRRILVPAGLLLLALVGTQTTVRSTQFGDAWGFPFFEAENHPYSTRANFFAGRICGELMTKHPDKKDMYFNCAVRYMSRSIQVNSFVTEPLIALAQIHINARYRIPQEVINEMKRRLKYQALGNDGAYLAKGLLEIGYANDQFVDNQTVDDLFTAGISNPSLRSTNKAHFLASYGIFLCEVMNKCEDAIKQFKLASEISSSPQFLIVLGTYQLRLGKVQELNTTLELAESRDSLGYFSHNIRSLKEHRMLYFQPLSQ